MIDRDALNKMTPDEVAAAVADGSLDHLLGGRQHASAGADQGARRDVSLTESIKSWPIDRLAEAVTDRRFRETIIMERDFR